jgi:hypothetical protein
MRRLFDRHPWRERGKVPSGVCGIRGCDKSTSDGSRVSILEKLIKTSVSNSPARYVGDWEVLLDWVGKDCMEEL